MPNSSSLRRVLFLCTGNSCRSQMAEGLLRELGEGRYESLSAGSRPSGYVHPLAIRAMAEIGIDIAAQESKSIQAFLPPLGSPPDLVISVCDSAAAECPMFPAMVQQIHIPFDDPAHATGSEDEQMVFFRRVRDQIRETISSALQSGAWETSDNQPA